MSKKNLTLSMNLLRTLCIVLTSMMMSGCVTFSNHGIPADRLPYFLRAPEKGTRIPLNLSLLGQREPRTYTINTGDLLGVYIRGVLPGDTAAVPPALNGQANFTNIYYPPTGQTSLPAVGFPVEVNPSGSLMLPLIGPIQVDGLTIEQATDKIAKVCVEKKVVQSGKEFVYLTLIRSKVHRIVVIRDEVQADSPSFQPKVTPLLTKRGFAQVVDLPTHENDVLHALSISGGLPAFDAYNEVWVLRREQLASPVRQQIIDASSTGQAIATDHYESQTCATATRIPLWIHPDQTPTFCEKDVILNEGDVVYIQSRNQEYFYTGGLLAGGMIPMPRDRDIDILEAISLANGAVGGAGGVTNVELATRSGGPGNVIPPSRATVIRKLPNDKQITIRVDLAQAVRDPKHRILIQPQDMVNLHYKPGEVVTNSALNLFGFSFFLND
jgi:hypothetical protein